jgi:mannose-1-phosphate guanylyltransferase
MTALAGESPDRRDVTGFILAAGRGTRLAPVTERLPKPLIPFFDVPLVNMAVDHLLGAGIRHIVVNVWHHGERLVRHLEQMRNTLPAGVHLDISLEPELLGTGGGLAYGRRFYDGRPVLVVNSDVFFHEDLSGFLKRHSESGRKASILLESGKRHPMLRTTRLTPEGLLDRIEPAAIRGSDFGIFTGIYVLEPDVYRLLPEAPCSVVTAGLRKAQAGGVPVGGELVAFPWDDLGTWKGYWTASMQVLGQWAGSCPDARARWLALRIPGVFDRGVYRGPGAFISPSSQVHRAVLGADSGVSPGAVVEGAVVLPGVHVADTLVDSVAGPGFRANE